MWCIFLVLLITPFVIPSIVLGEKVDKDLTEKNPLDLEFTYQGEKIDFNMGMFYFKTGVQGEYNVEIWYEIPNKNLQFKASEDKNFKNKLVTKLILSINAFSQGEKIENRSQLWSVAFAIDDENEAKEPDKTVMGNLNFTLKAGTYVVKLGVTDAISQKIGIEKIKFVIPEFDESKIQFSSFKYVDKVEEPLEKGSEDDIYYVKDVEKRIFPNIQNKFKTESEFNVFYEIYNLKVDSMDKPDFVITYYFNRIEKPEKEDEPVKIHKVYKKTITCPKDSQGSISRQIYMFKLFKEIEHPKTKEMKPLFIPGSYEMIVDIVDRNRSEDDQEKGIKSSFIIEE